MADYSIEAANALEKAEGWLNKAEEATTEVTGPPDLKFDAPVSRKISMRLQMFESWLNFAEVLRKWEDHG